MRVRLRISICSDCGTLLLRPAPYPINIPRPRLSQFESRRSIAWKSLFGLIGSSSKPKTTGKPPPPPDHESRKRAEATVRRLREAREARKPIDVSPPDNLPQQESTPPAPSAAPNIRTDPPPTAPASPPSRTFTPEKPDGRQAKLKQVLSNYNEPLPPQESDSFLFSKPLRDEQKAALKGYLNMASPLKPKRQQREKYPWEEEPLPPLPWENERKNINHVRELVDSRETELAKEKELRKRIPRVSQAEVPDGPPTGKLYKTLRLHHDIVQKARIRGNAELVSKANQELERQLVLSTQSLGKGEKDLIAFRNLLKPSAKETLPPLITYLLAREGFDPTKGYHLVDKLPENASAKDKFGRLTGSLLDEMTWNCMNTQISELISVDYHTKIFRGIAVGIESFACKVCHLH
jgi:hypothetical protein